ncbi:MAG: hypothetical protein K1060chlam2_00861 [Chlamydiae bacterium]|nr:hypothetical protein [Chlamydiota bacterium]
MFKQILTLFLALSALSYAQIKEGTDEPHHIRILKLLPYIVHPPLVDPCLPEEFTLGQKEDDPYFSSGYYWGPKGTLSDYFDDSATLKGCLIRAQVSTKVTQLGLDRFSCDGERQNLVAAGFTEINVIRGKWDIFPFRKLHAKGLRGRHTYQMWVGLNSEGGATLLFQFIYPDYLNEPTQNQKGIWEDFVHKTSLLSLNDLLVAHGIHMKNGYTETSGIHERVRISVEKRRFDQKLFITIEPLTDIKTHVEIEGLHDINFLNKFATGQPLVEIDSLITESGGETISEKVRVLYNIVDHFSFTPEMLSANRFEENQDYILFQ